ncbi:MAG: Fic family protein, partial [Clostridiales Family XIII bacterium]|nr:Fic family protein [Clostridiales Family XIII bacterium]
SVPRLIAELRDWGRESQAHPLIKSSAVHFMIEHIHPFRDGNGRIGRLWQTLILSKWKPIFAWMPIETFVHYNQALYYRALQESHAGDVDCAPFISCMLDMIENSMYRFIDIASETKDDRNMVREIIPTTGNDLTNDPISAGDPINDLINDPIKMVLACIKDDPFITYEQLAKKIKKSPATVKRSIQQLKSQGIIVRVGANKNGRWDVR